MSDKLLKDLTDIVEDHKDKLPEDDREDLEDIVSDLKENMAKIVEHGERAIDIIQGILLVSRGKEKAGERICMAELSCHACQSQGLQCQHP